MKVGAKTNKIKSYIEPDGIIKFYQDLKIFLSADKRQY